MYSSLSPDLDIYKIDAQNLRSNNNLSNTVVFTILYNDKNRIPGIYYDDIWEFFSGLRMGDPKRPDPDPLHSQIILTHINKKGRLKKRNIIVNAKSKTNNSAQWKKDKKHQDLKLLLGQHVIVQTTYPLIEKLTVSSLFMGLQFL